MTKLFSLKRVLATALIGGAILFGSTATFAQGRWDRDDHRHDRYDRRDNRFDRQRDRWQYEQRLRERRERERWEREHRYRHYPY